MLDIIKSSLKSTWDVRIICVLVVGISMLFHFYSENSIPKKGEFEFSSGSDSAALKFNGHSGSLSWRHGDDTKYFSAQFTDIKSGKATVSLTPIENGHAQAADKSVKVQFTRGPGNKWNCYNCNSMVWNNNSGAGLTWIKK